MAKLLIVLTEGEYQFLLDTLDCAKEEFITLIHDEDWYVTEMDERCETASNIIRYSDKLEIEEAEWEKFANENSVQ